MSSRSVRVAAVVAAVGFAGMACFHVLLVLGLPLGQATFGGASAILPTGLRVVSAVSAVIVLAGLYTVLARAGVVVAANQSRPVRLGIWVFAAIFGLIALANIASSSPWERFLMAPIDLVLTACCVIVARSTPAVLSAR